MVQVLAYAVFPTQVSFAQPGLTRIASDRRRKHVVLSASILVICLTLFNIHPSVIRTKKDIHGKEIISFKPVNKSEVQRTLESLNTRKATGHDCILAKVMKLGARELTTPLTNLYNFCISHGTWPCNWKKGEWVPVFKRDDPQDRDNYRPVTIFPAEDKVFE